MRRHALPLFAVVFGLAGCGPTNFKAFCEHSAGSICRAVFRCTPEDARRVWPNIQDCTIAMSTRIDCAEPAAASCTIDAEASSRCLDDLDNMVCAATFVVPTSCDLHCTNSTK